MAGLLTLLATALTGQTTSPPPAATPRLELAAAPPFLRVLGAGLFRLRIQNPGPVSLEGGPPADWDRGLPQTFVGQWFADAPAEVLGRFEVTLRLPRPVPPAGWQDIAVPVRAMRPGRRFACFGLLRSSRDGTSYQPLGSPLCLPVEVAPGSALENQRPELLRGLVAVHWAGLGASALAAFLIWKRRG